MRVTQELLYENHDEEPMTNHVAWMSCARQESLEGHVASYYRVCHIVRVMRDKPGWGYSVVVLGAN